MSLYIVRIEHKDGSVDYHDSETLPDAFRKQHELREWIRNQGYKPGRIRDVQVYERMVKDE